MLLATWLKMDRYRSRFFMGSMQPNHHRYLEVPIFVESVLLSVLDVSICSSYTSSRARFKDAFGVL